MRFYVVDNTLIVKGEFEGLSTGMDGGRRRVSCVFNHNVPSDFDDREPLRYTDSVAAKLCIKKPYFGLLTAVMMKELVVVRDTQLTAFVTAGLGNNCHDPSMPGTINIILVVNGVMSEGALASAIITATEAKVKALFEAGHDFTGTTTDAVVVLYEKMELNSLCDQPYFEYSGTYTDIGQSIYRCVKKGVMEGLKRSTLSDDSPYRHRTFINALIDGKQKWIEHPAIDNGKGKCPYYPCHYEGQDCTYCYCPFYPCGDKELGRYIMGRTGCPVWTCKNCTLLHSPDTAEYLKEHPEASVEELKKV
jgi:adenosylcobinamide hydrolase